MRGLELRLWLNMWCDRVKFPRYRIECFTVRLDPCLDIHVLGEPENRGGSVRRCGYIAQVQLERATSKTS